MKDNKNKIIQAINRKLNSYSKINLLCPSNIYLKNKSNLILKYDKKHERNELKKSYQKISQKNLTTSSQNKFITNRNNNLSNSLYKNSPKYLLSSLENNVLLGKLSQRRNNLFPRITNNKQILKTNIKKN